MKAGIVILVVLLILAFVLGARLFQPTQSDGHQARSGECRVGPG